MDVSKILKKIEMRRIELGISKKEFYEKSGISSATYSQWNTGTFQPSKRKLMAAASALKMSFEELVGQSESAQKERPASTSGDELEEAIIIGRDGKKIKRTYTKDQMDAIRKVIDVMPFVNDEEIFDGSLDDF